MSPHRMTLEIERITVSGAAFTPAALARVRARVEGEVARTMRRASWPAESLHSKRLLICADAPIAPGEEALANGIVASVVRALGAAGSGGQGDE